MSFFSFLLLCIQACLIQNVFSQGCGYNFGRGYDTGLDIQVDAVSRASAGLSGYGVGSNGLSASGFGLSNANVDLGGINTIGLGGANFGFGGINGIGLGGAGSIGSGFTGGYGYGVPDVSAIASLPVTGPYGGTGFGELLVGGTLDAAGSAVVTGQVPVLGAVSFNGYIPSSGVVSIAGNCACGGLVL